MQEKCVRIFTGHLCRTINIKFQSLQKMPNIAVRLQGLILFHIPNLFSFFREPRKQNYNLKTKKKLKNLIHFLFFFLFFCVRLLISSWGIDLILLQKLKMFSNKKRRSQKKNYFFLFQISRVRSVAPAGSFEFYFSFLLFSYTLHQIKAK